MADRPQTRRWGIPVWQRPHLTPRVRQVPNPDVFVIGGGLTGMSAAYHLAIRGIRTLVMDSGEIGDGASGRTGGIVLEGTAAGIREGADDCVRGLATLVRELDLDCDLHLPGCWEIEHGAGTSGNQLPWRDNGVPIHVARTVAGGSVDPAALLEGIMRAAIAAGAEVRPACGEIRFVNLKPFVRLQVEGASRTYTPQSVVVSANAWTAQVVPGVPEIHSALTYAIVTEPLAPPVLDAIGLSDRIPFYTSDQPYLWGRVTRDSAVVFGAGLTFSTPARLSELDVSRGEPRAILERLGRRIRKLNPALSSVGLMAQWAGPIAFTEDALPILSRHPDSPNLFVAGAYAGHGVAFSVHAGAAIARAIAEDAPLPAWGRLDR